MPVFNQSRSRIIRLIFLATFIVITGQLFYLQVISKKYKQLADDNAILKKVVYPPRGIIFDRKHRPILNNTLTYDLMVTPNQAKGIDTSLFCQLMDIDTAEYRKRILTAIIKNKAFRPSVFESSLSPQKFSRIQENLWRFSNGFYIQERPIRLYTYNAAANILGYISEVDTNYLKKHKDDGYQSGDYAGWTGLEWSYEKSLMGQRGVQFLIKDNFNRIQGPYEKGTFDIKPVAGSNLHLSLDIELQEEGEKLMTNKVGSIVAIDPRTGGVLAMVSSPTYNPNYLTGSERTKHIRELMYNDPRLPLLNRGINATYSPGSTFKTLQALVGLHEGIITPTTQFSCPGAFYGCGSGHPMGCLDPGTFSLQMAITKSCNTYFANVMMRVINNPKFPDSDSSLRNWDRYMYAFGLGHKLGIDLPTEQKGHIPTPVEFDKLYGQDRWNFCNFRSVSIGQGEVNVTPLQVANEMAYIANKGWFYTPHMVDSIEGGDKLGVLEKFKTKNHPIDIPDSVFEYVHNGMQGVVDAGTGMGARIDGINICGKTGTVENYYKGTIKLNNHSFFCAFAPRENPKIAIMCVVENSGRFGGTYAAPIVSLMIEKYLRDTIAASRKPMEERMAGLNLIPAMMLQKMKTRDSLQQIRRDSIEQARKAMTDTLQSEMIPDDDQPTGTKKSTPAKPEEKKPAKPEMVQPDSNKKRNPLNRITRP